MHKLDNIRVKGFNGTYYEIERFEHLVVVEHCDYGDEVEHLLIDDRYFTTVHSETIYTLILDEAFENLK